MSEPFKCSVCGGTEADVEPLARYYQPETGQDVCIWCRVKKPNGETLGQERLRARLDMRRHLMANLSATNSLWVALQHKDIEVLRSRRAWVERWRADKLAMSRVRAKRLYFPMGSRRIWCDPHNGRRGEEADSAGDE